MKASWLIAPAGIAGVMLCGVCPLLGGHCPFSGSAQAATVDSRVVTLPGAGALPSESPSATCYKYTYPKDKACGKMAGKSECEEEPSEDEDDCKVEKGAECTCAGDDDDDDE